MANDNQLKKTATIETSQKWSLSKPEFWRSGLTSLYVSITTIILQFLDAAITALTQNGTFHFDWVNLLLTLKIAIATWIGDAIRRLLKESVTVIKVKPSDKTVTLLDDESGTEIPTKPPPGGDVPPPNP